MESRRCDRRRGQVLLMVTLALVPLFGILGLVTDIGYMQFVKMSARLPPKQPLKPRSSVITRLSAVRMRCVAMLVWCAVEARWPARRT